MCLIEGVFSAMLNGAGTMHGGCISYLMES